MNLYDMARRGDTNLMLAGEVVLARRPACGELWRGLDLRPGAGFTIPDIRRFASFRHFPAQCGWMVEAPAGTALRLTLVAADSGKVVGSRTFAGEFQPVVLPWPQALHARLDLVVACEGLGEKPVFLANHRVLSRQWLIDQCRGRGVEIGPGPVPQVLPDEDRDVAYLEQMPAEEWNRLYNGGGKYPTRPDLWDRYIVGDAAALPVADGSLDFVFGSHVFEHLVNPLGHLARWARKLRKGGRVIMVVPDLNGTKDGVHDRCSLDSLIDELRRDIWEPETLHYSRHLRRPADDRHLVAAIARRESVHAHYYDNLNCQLMLDYAVQHLGYADFLIEHTPNHKDFHFVLQT